MSGIMESRRSSANSNNNNSSSSSSEDESSTGMSSRESTLDILDDSFEEDFYERRKLISGRGAMIGGVPITQQEEEIEPPPGAMGVNDVEVGAAARAPDSDYAPDYPAVSNYSSNGQSQKDYNAPGWLFPTRNGFDEASVTSRSSANDIDAPTKKNFERFSDSVFNKKGTSDKRQRKRLWYILGAVSILLLATAITVATMVFGSAGDMTSQQQQLSTIAKSISSESDLQNPASPQAKAYQWFIYEDTFYKDASNIPKDWAAQRYVLAVFYHATMGPYKWEVATNWLEGSECLDAWSGVVCSDQGYVRTLAFGKWVVHGSHCGRVSGQRRAEHD